MKFKHDILLIDLEMTGLNPTKHDITQIAGVLLDKVTLKEKKHFNQYIKLTPGQWKKADPEALTVSGHTKKILDNGSSLSETLAAFSKKFGTKVMLANWGGFSDGEFLKAAYEKTKLSYPFDYHFFNIWILAATYAASHLPLTNKKRHDGFDMEDLIKAFGIESKGVRHDALSDVRYEAEVLRELVKRVSFKK